VELAVQIDQTRVTLPKFNALYDGNLHGIPDKRIVVHGRFQRVL